MKIYLQFLFDHPFFAASFIFYTIPFWVPLAAIFFGADPALMLITALMIILAKSYVQAEITASNYFGRVFHNLLVGPFAVVARFALTVFATAVLIAYGVQGENIDKWIAAVMIVYLISLVYFRPSKSMFWSVRGIKAYRFYSFAGRTSAGVLWLVLLSGVLGTAESFAAAGLAVFIAVVTFLKTNEGLL
jgi:hypothetical protein